MSGCQGFLSYLLSYPNHGVGGTNVLGIGRVVSDNGYLIKDVYIRIKIKLKTSFFLPQIVTRILGKVLNIGFWRVDLHSLGPLGPLVVALQVHSLSIAA